MSQIDLWYATRATGVVALVLLTATVFLGVMVAGRAKTSLPAFARAEVHRNISVLTLVFLAIHVLTSVLDTYVNIDWLSIVLPFSSSYHRGWLALGAIGVDMFLAVAVSSALRRHIPARAWRALHWLAYLSWPTAISHTLGMGTDAKFTWLQALVGGCVALVLGALAWRVVSAARARAARPRTIMTPRRSLRLGDSAEVLQ
jgi:methionine sulfoxide reductase heme-binding subunit